MPAHTTTDAQNLIDGGDLSVTVDMGAGQTAYGVLIRPHVDALDYDARSLAVTMSNSDASTVVRGDSLTISGSVYNVRGIEVGDYFTTLQLGTP